MLHPGRRSTRLLGYDYARAGAYFVTACTHRRIPLLGRIRGGAMRPSEIGALVVDEWKQTASVRPHVRLDAFVVMPDHLHGVLVLTGDGGSTCRLGDVLQHVKSQVTRQARTLRNDPDLIVWQRGFHDRIIRTRRELHAVRRYVGENPMRWALRDGR